jgi:hypothetical protein
MGEIWAQLTADDFALEACLRPTFWVPVHLEKLIAPQLVKVLQEFRETRRFISTMTRAGF